MMKNRLLLATVIVISIDAFSTGRPTSAQSPDLLFTLKETPAAAAEKSSPAAVREAEIQVNYTSLDAVDREMLAFPLFDGQQHQARRYQTELRASDDFTWRGRISEGKIEGDVVLTFRKGVLAGLIYGAGAVYEIIPRGEKYFLVELDQSRFPECGGAIAGDGLPETNARANTLAAQDSGDRIDVLVVYTTATKNFLGGDAQAQAFAQQAIDAANTAYLNSRIRQRLRMAHAREYLYAESGSGSTDLSNLRGNAEIQNLRSAVKADLVAMIGEVTNVCGVAYLMGTQLGGNPNNGYSVTARSCAVGNLTFAHELGHNMGSQHNPENGSGATYPYGYGHYVNGVFRTVMSYVDQCPAGCARRPYFSNPEIFFGGYPTGIDNARDNARSINNTADAIANYRYSGSSLMLTNFNGGETLARNIARQLTWTSDNLDGNVRIEISRDAGVTWQTLATGTPNDGAENITIYGRATRQARLRVVSHENPIVSDSSVANVAIR